MATLQSTTVNDTGYLILPKGTTAQRPGTPTAGMIRYNTDYQYTEVYNGSTWNLMSDAIPTYNSAPAGTGFAVNNAGYRIHSYIYREIYNSNAEVQIADDGSDANYKVMKSFTSMHTGTVDVRFTAYIQSGTYYWAWRIRKNSSTVLSSGHYGNGPFYGNDISSVHDYRRFISSNLSVSAGDVITIEMVSSDGSGNPVNGNGQYLILKDAQVFLKGHTFTPSMSGLVEVMVVAGGGSGGAMGGGGAGGVVYSSAYPVVAGTSYSITVGAGGAGTYSVIGLQGNNSVFDTLTATGGGYGGGATAGYPPSAGGSGGGGQGLDYAGTGASGTSGQGYSGGTGITNGAGTAGGGGGGGGAGGPGVTASVSYMGAEGGRGITSNITGFPVTYAAGGGGGAYYYNGTGSGGLSDGGGKGGGHGVIGSDGAENTGSGGGGAGYIDNLGYNTSSGSGAAGIVIVRYPYQGPTSVAVQFTQVGNHYWTCPSNVSSIELLVVGGGGSGGEGHGGGGGAGGVVYSSAYPVSAGTTYSITVGYGGKFANSGSNGNGNSGGNSVFNDVTGYGGGYGGAYATAGGAGGSSGGSGGAYGSTNAPYYGQGNIGGHGSSITNGGGGGGGGAAGPGGNAHLTYSGGGGDVTQNSGSRGGNGGSGLPFAISGQVKYYGGGGGGGGEGHSRRGRGGLGGGGDGGYYSLNGMPQSGLHGTGGGGGGGSAGGSSAITGGRAGGAGGSGIVIIRYNLS